MFIKGSADTRARLIPEMMSTQMSDYVRTHFDMSCDQCDDMFESFQEARKHYILAHGETRGYIKCCGIKLKSLLTVSEHVDMHLNPERLK